MKIAIASSGLAHIKRGVETWADDLGAALRRRGLDATTFQGSGESVPPSQLAIGCWKRTDPKALRLVEFMKGKGGWRIGLGNSYDVEQLTFALRLFPRIRSRYDILHVQDPWLAVYFDKLHRAGLSRPHVILGHGTEEEAWLLRRYSNLQHLAPNYMEDWAPHKPPAQKNFAIPNFVDIDRFSPGDKLAARAACGLPKDALIVLSVGALNTYHKRMDYLLQEFFTWRESQQPNALLVLVGARESETDAVLDVAARFDPNGVRIVENAPRSRVLDFLRAADIFTLASLHEMLPIAALEALATGLPIACSDTPTFRWLAGGAGKPAKIDQPGGLVQQFQRLADAALRSQLSVVARQQAESVFGERVVVDQVAEMYRQVLAD